MATKLDYNHNQLAYKPENIHVHGYNHDFIEPCTWSDVGDVVNSRATSQFLVNGLVAHFKHAQRDNRAKLRVYLHSRVTTLLRHEVTCDVIIWNESKVDVNDVTNCVMNDARVVDVLSTKGKNKIILMMEKLFSCFVKKSVSECNYFAILMYTEVIIRGVI